MSYIEYSASCGEGSLIEHGVFQTNGVICPADVIDRPASYGNKVLVSNKEISEQEALEWKDIHGGWVAV